MLTTAAASNEASRVERDAQECAFVLNILQRKYWSLDDVIYSHTGLKQVRHRRGGAVRQHEPIHASSRPNPTYGYLSLHWVRRDTPEFVEVSDMARIEHHTIATVLRVQNYPLMDTFTQFMRETDQQYARVGFHSTNQNRFLENIMLTGLNPAIADGGMFGRGAYVAVRANMSLEGYSEAIQTPLFKDVATGEPCVDTYRIVLLFACNPGRVCMYKGGFFEDRIPEGYGAFVDKDWDPEAYCFQEYERTCPAYILICRVNRTGQALQSFRQQALQRFHQGYALDTSGKWQSETVGLSIFAAATGLPDLADRAAAPAATLYAET
jgi:hypothetical protein